MRGQLPVVVPTPRQVLAGLVDHAVEAQGLDRTLLAVGAPQAIRARRPHHLADDVLHHRLTRHRLGALKAPFDRSVVGPLDDPAPRPAHRLRRGRLGVGVAAPRRRARRRRRVARVRLGVRRRVARGVLCRVRRGVARHVARGVGRRACVFSTVGARIRVHRVLIAGVRAACVVGAGVRAARAAPVQWGVIEDILGRRGVFVGPRGARRRAG